MYGQTRYVGLYGFALNPIIHKQITILVPGFGLDHQCQEHFMYRGVKGILCI